MHESRGTWSCPLLYSFASCTDPFRASACSLCDGLQPLEQHFLGISLHEEVSYFIILASPPPKTVLSSKSLFFFFFFFFFCNILNLHCQAFPLITKLVVNLTKYCSSCNDFFRRSHIMISISFKSWRTKSLTILTLRPWHPPNSATFQESFARIQIIYTNATRFVTYSRLHMYGWLVAQQSWKDL